MKQLEDWEANPIDITSSFKTAITSLLDTLRRRNSQLNFKEQ